MTLPAQLRVPAWMLLGAAVVGFYVAGRKDGAMDDQERRAEAEARAVLAAGTGYRAQLQRLRADEAAALGEARDLHAATGRALGRADSLQVVADSLAKVARGLEAAQTASGDPSPCAPAFNALRACQEASAGLRITLDSAHAELRADSTALEKADLRAGLAEARANTVDGTLHDLLAAKGCRILDLLPCPSRRLAFGAGAAAAAVTIYLLLH